MKTILGLDLGTNSIGWALIEVNHELKILKIIGLGSRIIPMDGQEFSKFNAGQKIVSSASNRTGKHRVRITKERYLLRRDRLHLVLNLLEALPEHYKIDIDFERNNQKSGKFKNEKEPKIAYLPYKNEDGKFAFYYEEAFNKMIADLQKFNPNISNEKGKRIPKDWTIYYLRNKALKEKIYLEELAWVLLSYNQKRGFEQLEIEDDEEKTNEIKELLDLRVINVENKSDANGVFYEVTLNDAENFTYKEYSTRQLSFKDDIKEVIKISKLDEAGNVIEKDVKYQISDLYKLTIEDIKHTEIDEKIAKHKYDFIYTNGWLNEKKTKKSNYSFEKIAKEILEKKIEKSDLYVVKNAYNSNGNPETLIPSIKIPDFNSEGSKDWTLLKKRTEKDAIAYNISKGYINSDGSSKHYISPKIYDVLRNDAKSGNRTKIIGGLFQTIDRKFYREELYQIIETQKQFHTKTLNDKTLFEKCVKLLYPHNEDHSKTLLENKKAIAHLLVDDILLYQRPLKSKKIEISDCKYEIDYWKEDVNTATGEIVGIPVYKKAISASHPLFQEYRIWDKIHNIKLIQVEGKDDEGKSETNVDVTNLFFKKEDDYLALFQFFNNRKSVTMTDYLDFCKKRFEIVIGKKDDLKFVWNYPQEEEFKGNETRKSFEIRFKRCGYENIDDFLTQEREIALWHYLYSVNSKERKEISKLKESNNPKFGKSSIQNFFAKYFKGIELENEVFDKICNDFANYPKFDSKYSSFSVKALNKILPLIRIGDNFLTKQITENNFQASLLERTKQILEKTKKIDWSIKDIDYRDTVQTDIDMRKGEIPFPKGLFNTFRDFQSIQDFKFLNLTQASYLLYGRHSELAVAKYWKSPNIIREEINKELKHNSLNNPTAEKVLKETIKVVADLWEYYGNSEPKYFNKIHIEVARELQKSNKEKQEISKNQSAKRTENDRLRNILEEFLQNSPYNANKGNQDHFERLKILDEGARIRSDFDKEFYKENENKFSKTDIDKLLKKQKFTKEDFEKYKLWIEQGYRSPYTNKSISLTNLFNGKLYNVDHILPRALVTNDSLNNKIVCETIINKLKSNSTGRSFMANMGGRNHTVYDDNANKDVTVNLISEQEYVDLVKRQFSGGKKFILLSKEVPDGFTNSQLNNTKHIARKAMELLSHIVREPGEVEYRSKNVLPVSGAITDKLKREWKLNQVWTELLTPRFERLNLLKSTTDFGQYRISDSGHQYFDINTKYILEQNKDFELKRLDHRHHALDALIIALCTENHIQYFNNINSGIINKKREKLAAIKKQRAGIKRQIMYAEPNKENPNEKSWIYMLPGAFRTKNTEGNDKTSVNEVKWQNSSIERPTSDFKKIILNSLQHFIVTFKNDFKLVSKSSNKYESYYDENGKLQLDQNGKPFKKLKGQKNDNNKHWSIRKPLHTDNPSAEIKLDFDQLKIEDYLGKADLIMDGNVRDAIKEILGMFDGKIGQAKAYLKKNPIIIEDEEITVTDFKIDSVKYRKRQPITELSRRTGTGALKTYDEVVQRIRKVADFKLRNDLLEHLKKNYNDIDIAFSLEGINDFNSNRKIPVYRIPISESASLKFAIGGKNYNNKQFVETGGNFHFRIIIEGNNRKYETVKLRDDIEYEKQRILKGQSGIDNKNEIILSPNDLVYVPTKEERENPSLVDFHNLRSDQINRIFVVNDFSGVTIYFTPNAFSKNIATKELDTSFDSKQSKLDGMPIKDICWKLETNRLGKITKVIK